MELDALPWNLKSALKPIVIPKRKKLMMVSFNIFFMALLFDLSVNNEEQHWDN